MLSSVKLVAFIATRDFTASKAFYGSALGLSLIAEDPYALVYDAPGTTLRITMVQEAVVAPYTVLGFDVPDIQAQAAALIKNGGVCERFEGMQQDAPGIWQSPSGARVAWFKDPTGHVLSITQH